MPSETSLARLRVGDRLPAESRRTLKGTEFLFRDPHQVRSTVLVFVSPWCEDYLATTRPEVSAACRTLRLQVDQLARDPQVHVRWLGIASGLWATHHDLVAYQHQLHVPIPLTLDESGRDFRLFDVSKIPAALIADDRGQILQEISSEQLSSPTALRAALGIL